jgi:hypothetical protein
LRDGEQLEEDTELDERSSHEQESAMGWSCSVTKADTRHVENAFSDRSTAFFNSDPNIDEDDASSWQFVKPLGTGSYGTVAVWTRKDQSEFCAVKDEEYRPPQQQYGNEREGEDYEGMYQGIVKEAV